MGRVAEIERNIQDLIGSEVTLLPYGINSYRVITPFLFDDGDNLSIVLKNQNEKWLLTDEGHTLMHLSYDIDDRELRKGTRAKIINNVLKRFGVEDQNGSFVLQIESDGFGPYIFDYIQALLHVTDISFLSREQVRSTFFDDFKELISSNVPADRLTFDWHHSILDPDGHYSVDCRINGMPLPLMIFAVSNDSNARDATIKVHQYEKWDLKFNAVAIFEDQESIQRSVLARLSDVFGKQFSSLSGNKERIHHYLEDTISVTG